MRSLADKLTANTLMTAIGSTLFAKADEYREQSSLSKKEKNALLGKALKFQTMALIAADRSCTKRAK